MANVRSVKGISEESQRVKIKEMRPGDVGYTVEWALDEDTQRLNTEFTIHEKKGGTVSMRVECVGPGQYDIAYEEPVYSPIGVLF